MKWSFSKMRSVFHYQTLARACRLWTWLLTAKKLASFRQNAALEKMSGAARVCQVTSDFYGRERHCRPRRSRRHLLADVQPGRMAMVQFDCWRRRMIAGFHNSGGRETAGCAWPTRVLIANATRGNAKHRAGTSRAKTRWTSPNSVRRRD